MTYYDFKLFASIRKQTLTFINHSVTNMSKTSYFSFHELISFIFLLILFILLTLIVMFSFLYHLKL